MRRTTVSTVTSATRSVETRAPSRMTVMSSHSEKISSKRWEMNSTAAPRWVRPLITAKRRAASTPESAAVGSSITKTFARRERAFAISTSCWSAMDRPRAGRPGSMATPSRAKRRSAASFMASRSMRPNLPVGWRPMKMFSATGRSGKRVGS